MGHGVLAIDQICIKKNCRKDICKLNWGEGVLRLPGGRESMNMAVSPFGQQMIKVDKSVKGRLMV